MEEKTCQPYVNSHLEEFTLQVLKDTLNKVSAPDVLDIGNHLLAVFLLLFIVVSVASQALAHDADCKEQQKSNCQAVVADNLRHLLSIAQRCHHPAYTGRHAGI